MNSDHRKEIEELVEILTEQNLTEVEIEREGLRIRVRRAPAAPSSAAHPPAAPAASEPSRTPEAIVEIEGTSGLVTVTSPIVGTFYRASSPDAEPFVEEGDLVSRGQVLCIVEAMKFMNEIEAEADGRIVQVLVESGTAVEYGQPLFVIDPHPET